MILELGEGVGTISVREILEVGVWAILVLVIVEKNSWSCRTILFLMSVVVGVILVTI